MDVIPIVEQFCSYCNKSLTKVNSDGVSCYYAALYLKTDTARIQVCSDCALKAFIQVFCKDFCTDCMIDILDGVYLRG